MMKVLWTPEAIKDRSTIYDYIEADNPSAALALDKLLSEKVSRLASHPTIGKPGRLANTREFVAHQNYILVYDIARDRLRILRILHAALKWPLTS